MQHQEVDVEQAPIQRKRKQKQVEEAVVEAPAVPVEAPPPQLTQRELYELRLAEAEIRCAQKEMEASKFRRLYILALLDPKGRVAAEEKAHDAALKSVQETRRHYQNIQVLAGKRLGLDLSKCSFDADTGVVIPDSARG